MTSSDVNGDALQSILATLGQKTINEAQMELIVDTIKTIQNKKIGIFEVPTLKEESINVFCSICTWLKEYSNINKHTNKDTDQGEGSKKRSHTEVDQEEDDHGKGINNPTLKRNHLSGEQSEDDLFDIYSLESRTFKLQSPEQSNSGSVHNTPSSSAQIISSGQNDKIDKGKSKAIPNIDSEEAEMPDAKLIYVFRSRNRLEQIIKEVRTFDFIQKEFDVFEGMNDPNFSSTSQSQKIQVIVMHIDDLIKNNLKSSINNAVSGNILLFDESHDIVDYIIKQYSAVVGESNFEIAISHLQNALDEEEKEEMKKELDKILENLVKFEKFFGATDNPKLSVMSPAKFLDQVVSGGIDEKMLQDLADWLRQTANNHTILSSDKVALQSVQILMYNLINPDFKGYVHYLEHIHDAENSSSPRQEERCHLEYQLLNPSVVFEPIVQQARSVILLGEVMDPMVNLKIHLFPHISNDYLVKKVYSHLIPNKSMISGIVQLSPKGEKLQIDSNTREKPALMERLLEMIVEYCKVIPDGVVVFVSTHDYLQTLKETWKKSNLYTTLKSKKDIFFVPNDIAKAKHELQKYKDAIYSTFHTDHSPKTGAILFTAVISDFSEMIDFKDRLARGVIMIGMPFTYRKSPEWKESERHLYDEWRSVKILSFLTEEQKARKREKKLRPGEECYVAQCFNSVNRCIGKAISHQNDFAAIVLLDSRYSESRNKPRLSEWIRIKGGNNCWVPFERSITDLKMFFEGR